MLKLPYACAYAPVELAPNAVANEPTPTAVVPFPKAWAYAPNALATLPAATECTPTAVESAPFAVALSPQANELAPVAVVPTVAGVVVQTCCAQTLLVTDRQRYRQGQQTILIALHGVAPLPADWLPWLEIE